MPAPLRVKIHKHCPLSGGEGMRGDREVRAQRPPASACDGQILIDELIRKCEVLTNRVNQLEKDKKDLIRHEMQQELLRPEGI